MFVFLFLKVWSWVTKEMNSFNNTITRQRCHPSFELTYRHSGTCPMCSQYKIKIIKDFKLYFDIKEIPFTDQNHKITWTCTTYIQRYCLLVVQYNDSWHKPNWHASNGRLPRGLRPQGSCQLCLVGNSASLSSCNCLYPSWFFSTVSLDQLILLPWKCTSTNPSLFGYNLLVSLQISTGVCLFWTGELIN